LKASDWNLEGAFDYFYNQPPSRPTIDFRQLDELYARYKGIGSKCLIILIYFLDQLVSDYHAFLADLQIPFLT
jgi:hypothetical protein